MATGRVGLGAGGGGGGADGPDGGEGGLEQERDGFIFSFADSGRDMALVGDEEGCQWGAEMEETER